MKIEKIYLNFIAKFKNIILGNNPDKISLLKILLDNLETDNDYDNFYILYRAHFLNYKFIMDLDFLIMILVLILKIIKY